MPDEIKLRLIKTVQDATGKGQSGSKKQNDGAKKALKDAVKQAVRNGNQKQADYRARQLRELLFLEADEEERRDQEDTSIRG